MDPAPIADPPPWWGVPAIAGGFLILGAILGFLFNSINERRKEKREDSKKWNDELRLEAAQLVTLAHQLVLDAPDLQSARTDMTDSEDIDLIKAYLQLSEEAVTKDDRAVPPQHHDQADRVTSGCGEERQRN